MPVAATDEPGSSSAASRFQSTALANAWRTQRVVERRLADVEAVVGDRQRGVAPQRRPEAAVVRDPAGVDEPDRRHVDVPADERVDRALAVERGQHPDGVDGGLARPVARVRLEDPGVRVDAVERVAAAADELAGIGRDLAVAHRRRHDRERGAGDDRRAGLPPPRSRSTTTVRSPSARTPSVDGSVDAPLSRSRAPTMSATSEASGDGLPGVNRRRQLWTTSSAVSGVPSLNARPSRRVKVTWLAVRRRRSTTRRGPVGRPATGRRRSASRTAGSRTRRCRGHRGGPGRWTRACRRRS